MKQLDCEYITNQIEEIVSLKSDLDDLLSQPTKGNIDKCLGLKIEISQRIEEIMERHWPLEILTKENIEKQFKEWQEMYENLGTEYHLPTMLRVMEFMKDEPGFLELMKKKEKQGLTRLILAPAPGFYSLKSLAHHIEKKVSKCGGTDNEYGYVWEKMFEHESDVCYFGKFGKSYPDQKQKPQGGVTVKEIWLNPDQYSICHGWMVSFTTEEQEVVIATDTDRYTGKGRKAIRAGLTADNYEEKYFSENDETYVGEKAMIPQEHFALFAKDFYERYIKPQKNFSIIGDTSDLFDSTGSTWFTSTHLPGLNDVPSARWTRSNQQFYCMGYPSILNDVSRSARAVVRRTPRE